MTAAETGAAFIERSIRAATERGHPAIAAFLTAGFPNMPSFGSLLDAVAAEADIVEIGVPFTDPMADGVTIQKSSRIALDAGVTLPWILDIVADAHRPAPIVLMSYLNPIIAFGIQAFVESARGVGVAGLIVPDLPYEESAPLREALEAGDLALVQLVTPVSPPARIGLLCEVSRGFVYAVTTTGTTGGNMQGRAAMFDYLDAVRAVSPVPVLAGFGIRGAEQVRAVSGHADGVIVGSALIEVLEGGDDPIAYLQQLRDNTETTSEGHA